MKELGQSLKSERLKQGLTLQNISEATRISVGMLQTLEEGQYERIGTSLLIRSFFRAYCSALGMDPEAFLQGHSDEILAYDQQKEGIRRYQVWSAAFRVKKRKRLIVLVLALALVGAVTAGILVAKRNEILSLSSMKTDINPQQELPSDLPKGQPSPQPPSAEDVKEAKAVPEPAAGSVPGSLTPPPTSADKASSAKAAVDGGGAAEATAEPSGPPQTEQHLLVIEADQKSWIQVRIDGKKRQDLVLHPGDKREWKEVESVLVILGNAGAVRMEWDGNPVKISGKPGQAVRVKLPEPKKAP